jgi:chorismate mutase-like protein
VPGGTAVEAIDLNGPYEQQSATMTDKLTPLRQQIDAIDAQILDLLSQRGRIAQEVGHVKAETAAPVFRPEREAQVLRGVADRNPGPLKNHDVQTIFREVMSACRALEKRVTVAYLGPAGTFSEQAVYQQFGRAVEGLPAPRSTRCSAQRKPAPPTSAWSRSRTRPRARSTARST